VVVLANATMFLFVMAFFGAGLLFPSYFQQLLGHTPFQSGIHLIPQGLGAMLTMPIAGRIMDKRGPGWVVLVGITVIVVGMGTFAYGVSQQYDYTPVLQIGLTVMGMGMGCTTMPVSDAAVQALGPYVARGWTLINVNQQVAGSIGSALMSVILTSQFNRSEYVSAATKPAAIQEEAAQRGVPPDPTRLPPQVLAPNFSEFVANDLSHAYTVMFAVAVCFVLTTLIPAAFLPKRPAHVAPGEAAMPAMAH
jgi:DHA2 family multidrug resistance protein